MSRTQTRPQAQDDLAVQDAWFASLKPADGSDAVQPMTFMSLEEAAKLPYLQYVVKGLIPSRGIGQIYGPPACYKSFTVLSLCIHISEGWDFCGRKVKKRPVFYLQLEGAGGISKRLQAFRAWMKQAGKPELAGVFRFWTHPFPILDGKACDALIAGIKAECEASGMEGAVIVVDTQSQASIGADENTGDMAKVLGNARKIAEAVGGVCVMIHHSGKNKDAGLRGHSSQLGNVDFSILAEKTGSGAVWTATKEKEEADGQSIGFKIHVFEVGTDEDGDKVTSCAAEPTAETSGLQAFNEQGGKKKMAPATVIAWRALDTVLKAAGAEGGGAVDKEDWKAEFVRTYLAGAEKSKKTEFYRQAKLMAAEGWIVVDGDKVSLYRPSVSSSDSGQQQHE